MKRFITLITIMALLISLAVPAMADEAILPEEAAPVTTEEIDATEEAEVTEALEEPAETEEAPEVEVEVSPQESAGKKLVEAKIVQGYEDGSLNLENTITRAEMATLIVKSAGLTAEAEALKGAESKFSDVKATDWFSGSVNLSAEKGWITGDPEGTFRPNDPVQYREAITMIMRALGYSNENLGGQWPENYVNKAVELEIQSGMELSSTEAAPRGDVFVVLANTIDSETSTFDEVFIFVEEAIEEEAPAEEAVEEEATEEVTEETVEEETTEEEAIEQTEETVE